MAQQLINVHKQKTFSEICPTWSKILKEGLNTGDIGLSDRCIVGEAWGWSNKYDIYGSNECKECHSFSYSFPCTISFKSKTELNLQINNFTKHYNKCHVNI
ncbi:MAG: hypothetical protein R3321_13855 [Nitrososphaeraceae archaeon]|nr:hypothetical protein [Nitrososphaeraceae archaeon]